MRPWPRTLLIAAGVIAAMAFVVVGWQWLRPIPNLNTRLYRTMLLAGRVGEAESLLRDHLRIAPDDPQANFLLAMQMIDRADPTLPEDVAQRQAEQVLERLAKADPQTPAERAVVKLYEGKALYVLKRWAEVEQHMKEAIELDPTVPEAGWALLDLYYLQGRTSDASELALRLHEIEPDPHDRVQLLLELVRQDAQPPDPASIIDLSRDALEAAPDDLRAATVLGDALIRNSRVEEGLDILRQSVDRHPDDPLAWQGLLEGHSEAGQWEELAEVLDRLPTALADDPRFLRYRARLAQDQGDWPAAVAAYRRAFEHEPHDPTLLYLLARVLGFAGEHEESERLMARHEVYKAASQQVEPLYNEANRIATLGTRPYPDLYQRLADLRERLLWPDQAAAWRRLADPGSNTESTPIEEAEVPSPDHQASAPAT